MSKTTTLLTVALSICAMLPTQAQWGTDVVNNAINWELHVWESDYSGSEDDDGLADPTIKTECFVNGVPQGEACKTWDCAPPCANGSPGGWWSGMGTPYSASLALYGVAFESDGADDCVFEASNGDHYWAGYFTLRDGLADMPIIYPSPDFAPCNWNPWLASGIQWLMPNTAQFDQRMRLAWRYAAGWGYEAPLDFGTVAMNTTKADVNANRAVSGQYSSASLQYSNSKGPSSPDVYYQFNIDQASTVTISTDHALTDFDTELYLYSTVPGGGILATDDESGNLPGTSTIVTQLCAGNYKVRVTGRLDSAGLFRLSVTAQAPAARSVSVTVNNGVSCAEANDGVVFFNTANGVPYMHYWVDGTDVGTSSWHSDLAMGEHLVEVIDACGSTASATFSVGNADATMPTALCEATLNIDVVEGQNTLLTPEEVDNGSSDNCGAIDLSVAPSSFSTSDVGLQGVVLTVTDENDNTSTCTCVVSVQNATGIAETAMAARIRVLPNPSKGHFRLDLSELSLSTDTRLHINDALGRAVFGSNPTKSVLDLDLGHLPDGAYTVRLSDPQWNAVERIVIQH